MCLEICRSYVCPPVKSGSLTAERHEHTTTTSCIRWTSKRGAFLMSMRSNPTSEKHIANPQPYRHFKSFAPKSFPSPSRKNPPRRNGHDWRGLQRCVNHLGIFVFPPRSLKAPRRANRVSLSATPEPMKRMPCGHLWRRCGNFGRWGWKT